MTTLEKFARRDRKRGNYPDILRVVCYSFEVTPRRLAAHDRREDIAWPRHALCWLAQELTPLSDRALGVLLGGRNHSSIFYSANRCRERMSTDAKWRAQMEFLRNQLQQKFNKAKQQ